MFLDVRLHERTFGNYALPPSARVGQGERHESLSQPPGAQRRRHECVYQRDRTRLAPIRKYRRPSLTSDLVCRLLLEKKKRYSRLIGADWEGTLERSEAVRHELRI